MGMAGLTSLANESTEERLSRPMVKFVTSKAAEFERGGCTEKVKR
jgi:hypothetical protein